MNRNKPTAQGLILAFAALLLSAACKGPPRGVRALSESLDSIATEMSALHEPRRVVEYHDRSGRSFWVAFVPPHGDVRAIAGSDAPLEEGCASSGLTTVAVGGEARTECVSLARAVVSAPRVIHKSAGSTVQITIDLDLNGYRIVDLK